MISAWSSISSATGATREHKPWRQTVSKSARRVNGGCIVSGVGNSICPSKAKEATGIPFHMQSGVGHLEFLFENWASPKQTFSGIEPDDSSSLH